MARKRIEVVSEPTSTCKVCRHAWFYQDMWLCRRYPPTVVFDLPEQTACSSFPVVAADLTCGEFSPKLND
jgi:hypothetical protein